MLYETNINAIKFIFARYLADERHPRISEKQADAILNCYRTPKAYEGFLSKIMMNDPLGKKERAHFDWLDRVEEQ